MTQASHEERDTRTSTGEMIEPNAEVSRSLEALGLVSPLGEIASNWQSSTGLIKDFSTLRLGFLDNSGPYPELFELVQQELVSRHHLEGTRVAKKRFYSRTAPPDLIEELARDFDVVVTGVGA